MQSKDVVTAIFILGVFGVLRILIKLMYTTVLRMMEYWISISGGGMGNDGKTIEGMQVYAKLVLEIGKVVLIASGPVLAVSVLLTIFGTGAQTRFLFTTESLKFKLS